jgi:hypothetical protein
MRESFLFAENFWRKLSASVAIYAGRIYEELARHVGGKLLFWIGHRHLQSFRNLSNTALV